MASLIFEERDVNFVLFEQLKIDEELCKFPRYQDYTRDMCEMVISQALKFSENTLFPLSKEGDKNGAKWDKGVVTTTPGIKEAYKIYAEAGYITPCESPDVGGQGLPHAVGGALGEMFGGANFPFLCFPNLTHGAARLIELFGTEEQQRLYMDRMYSGQWTGTMCLTEPGAGSDVGNIKTRAIRNPDGTFSIIGNKIFITAGDHDITENVVHAVLARIDGDPAGTKGISIFIVPKHRVTPDGKLTGSNDVYCSGIEKKMGLHASPTCSLSFGDNNKCIGYLLGKEREGMKIMFYMMNEARYFVGLQGQGHATAAYLHAVKYAKERLQGAHIANLRDANAPRAAIIQHPDIRRTLLDMKSLMEGTRSVIYFTGLCMDMAKVAAAQEDKELWEGFVELLIPVCKGYTTDRALEICSEAIQVFGGYGYCSEYPVEQFMRDCRISQIYEGTNGIQAMDLVGRKLGMKKGGLYMGFLKFMDKVLDQVRKLPADWKPYIEQFEKTRAGAWELPVLFQKQATSKDFAMPFFYSAAFLRVFGDLCVAWSLLWQATVAHEKLEALKAEAGVKDAAGLAKLCADHSDAAYYTGKLAATRHFIGSFLPVTDGRIAAIKNAEPAGWDVPEPAL